jgi:hypothetical protein
MAVPLASSDRLLIVSFSGIGQEAVTLPVTRFLMYAQSRPARGAKPS